MSIITKAKTLLPWFGREEKFRFWIRINQKDYRKHKTIAYIIRNHIYYKYNCDISSSAQISSSVRFPHPIGIVIGDGTVIGDHTTIFQNVTLGKKEKIPNDDLKGYPVIMDNCTIYPNTCVIGDVILRKGTIIGAGSVVTRSTEENSVCYGAPARRHGFK